MAKKSVDGQMDMFELFGSVEELEQKVKGMPETNTVMHRCFARNQTNEEAVVAYLDYNRVYLKDWDKKPMIYQFAGSKEAVDYYVNQLNHFLEDEQVKEVKKPALIEEAVVIRKEEMTK